MSKIQTSIQRAIEKSRGATPAVTPAKKSARRKPVAHVAEGTPATEIFPIKRTARPDHTVMEASRIVSELEDNAAISAYKLLRTRVLHRMRSNNWRTLIVTSSDPGEGKTLTCTNLALSLSRDVNQSVLLVDLDLQRSSVAKYFGFDMENDMTRGIGEYLEGNAEITDIIYNPVGLPRLSIIPNRQPMAHSSDLLSSPRMSELLAWIRMQSGRTVVLFDMPPVLACDDVVAFSPEIDAVLLVVSQGHTERTALPKVIEMLGDTPLLGVVLNKSDDVSGKNPYGYY